MVAVSIYRSDIGSESTLDRGLCSHVDDEELWYVNTYQDLSGKPRYDKFNVELVGRDENDIFITKRRI